MNVRATMFVAISLAGLLHAQQDQPNPASSPVDNGLLIHAETNLVLVDSVVTDKKGAYITDLKAKDFRVSEDGKDQPIKSFSFEADPSSGAPERTHYLVLVFDNSTMKPGDQAQAREAAAKFIDKNAGPNRMMAVVNFGGAMQVAQNFTSDAARLKSVVSGIQFSAVSPNNSNVGAAPQLSRGATTVAMDFAARDLLQTLRSVAKGLSSTPGRKIMVLFTAGFALTAEQQSEVTATVAECNRDNVAIYPVDVRGLVTGSAMPARIVMQTPPPPASRSVFQPVAFVPGFAFAPQSRGASPSPAPSAPSSSSRSTTTTAPSAAPSSTTSKTPAPTSGPQNTRPNTNPTMPGVGCVATGNGPGAGLGSGTAIAGVPVTDPCNANRSLIPKIPETATTNQQVMFMLASGTGGFVIHDSNDLLAGLDKIGKEQNQYYILGYTPPESKDGSCHVLKVKVERGGTEVRARTGYCSAKPMDILGENPLAKTLEAKLAASQPGKVSASMRLPYFYTAPNVARVNLAMELATDALKFEKKKSLLHSEINFLGIAYTPQGTVAARFSDTLKLDFDDKDDADAAKRVPLHYENQFDIAPGKYTLKLVYSEGGDNFGKLEMPLEIEPYNNDQLALSGLVLSKQYHRTSELGGVLDVAMIEDKTPLIADGLQIVPTGNPTFSKSDLSIFYIEMYEPLLVAADPKNIPLISMRVRVLDRKTGEQKLDTGFGLLDPAPPVGNLVLHLGGKMPVSGLTPGTYTLEMTAEDANGKSTPRTADFQIQ